MQPKIGIHRFDDIQNYLGITTSIVSDLKQGLEIGGILERRLYDLVPPRYEYWLTKKSSDTYPHSLSLMSWGDRRYAGAKGSPVLVTHKPCQHRLGGEVVCGECHGSLTPDNVRVGRFRRLAPGEPSRGGPRLRLET